MSISTPNPLLEPLLRSIMGMPPSLIRFAPQSLGKPLHTRLLRDTALATGLKAEFDDSCLVTTVAGDEERLGHVKLALPGKRHYSGVHLTLLSAAGQFNILLGGDHLKVFVGAGAVLRGTVQLANRASLFIGDGCTFAQARIIVTNGDVVFGDDCQIFDDLLLQAGDPHPISDLQSGELLNGERSQVHLGRHVWVGRRVLLLSDSRIGDGCIVSAGAVVSGNVGANSLVAGVPAQVVREGVGWAREFGKPPPQPGGQAAM